jgi:hypothetical protein
MCSPGRVIRAVSHASLETKTGGARRIAVAGVAREVAMSQEQKPQALARAAGLLCRDDDAGRRVLGRLWDAAFEEGRVDALDELQDRFCVCMK